MVNGTHQKAYKESEVTPEARASEVLKVTQVVLAEQDTLEARVNKEYKALLVVLALRLGRWDHKVTEDTLDHRANVALQVAQALWQAQMDTQDLRVILV